MATDVKKAENMFCNDQKTAEQTGKQDSIEDADHIRTACTGQNQTTSFGDDKLSPIAVIGIACTFPQDAHNVEAFWEMLIQGRSALTKIPENRFNSDAFCTRGKARAGMVNAFKAHFMKEDIASFDAPFFSISAQEAVCMDPQQRLLLETTYQALENAGLPTHAVAGTNTSVFVGSFMHDYENMLMRDPQMRGKHTSVGTGGSMLANRISWFYDLKGLSLTIDTACSSSLTAIHLACQSLRSGETDMALVGGCNVFFDPAAMSDITDMGILSRDGTPYCFDSRANGYVRGEGFGIVVLKRLPDAISDSNIIRSVIRATGASSSGRTPGITQPSEAAQAALIQKVYEEGGLDTELTSYFEAHGTGTPVGDLLEARAIHKGLKCSSNRTTVYIGAVKSNIGHLEGAAGIAGFIKTVLVLERGIIPPNLNFTQPNRKVLSDEWNIKFPQKCVEWPTNGIRRASQNSFGYGGSNAHVVLDDAYNYLRLRGLEGIHRTSQVPLEQKSFLDNSFENPLSKASTPSIQKQLHLLVWSAPDQASMKRLTSSYEIYFQRKAASSVNTSYISDLSYTLAHKRDRALWRSFGVVSSADNIRDVFNTDAAEAKRSSLIPELGFVFTGQGAQWSGMGIELTRYPIYKKSLEDADSFFRTIDCDWSLLEELTKPQETSRLAQPKYSQPICTALQIALVDLLRHWNITPSALAGHSSGEIAAAFCAGSISRETAFTLSFFRGLVSSEASNQSDGAMMSVDLSENAIKPYISSSIDANNFATIACINSPKNVTLSGSRSSIETIQACLEADSILIGRLNIDIAYHSTFMANAALKYGKLIRGSLFTKQTINHIRIVSSVTGQDITTEALNSTAYWVRNMTSPVLFADSIVQMLSPQTSQDLKANVSVTTHRISHLIEIGPHSTLERPLRDITECSKGIGPVGYNSVLKRGRNAVYTALELAGHLFSIGWPVDLCKVNGWNGELQNPSTLVDLPPYPFDHSKTYWLEGPASRSFRFRNHAYHELLGLQVLDSNSPIGDARWRNELCIQNTSWISDHQVNGLTVFPAAGIIAIAIEAARQLVPSGTKVSSYQVHDVTFSKAIIFPSNSDLRIETILRPLSLNMDCQRLEHEFHIYVDHDDQLLQACSGLVGVQTDSGGSETDQENYEYRLAISEIGKCSAVCGIPVSSNELYRHFRSYGLQYKNDFRRLSNVHVSINGSATATLNLPLSKLETENDLIQSYIVYPPTLDTIFQTALAPLYADTSTDSSTPVISKISSLQLYPGKIGQLKVSATTTALGSRKMKASLLAFGSRESSFRIDGEIQITRLGSSRNDSIELTSEQHCCGVMWKPDLDLLNAKEVDEYCSRCIGGSEVPFYNIMWKEKRTFAISSIANICKALKDKYPSLAKPHFELYVEWLRHAAIEHCKDCIANDPLVSSLDCIDKNNGENEWQLADEISHSGPDGEMLTKIVTNHMDILEGQVDALSVMFQNNLLPKLYAAMSRNNPAFKKLRAYIDATSHKRPGLKYLEIGGGTGGATKEVLDALTQTAYDNENEQTACAPRFEEYVFTDISSSFFEKARERFAEHVDRMRFAVLNIEEDPVKQGFTKGHYDVIVASNVLHATADLRGTIRNVRQLLKPGGRLVLHELTDPEALIPTLLYGLLPGWWLSTESDRKWGPLLTESSWNRYLSDCGFSGVDLAFREGVGKDHLTSIMLSTAEVSLPDPIAVPKTLIALEKHSKSQQQLALLIQRFLQDIEASSCEQIDVEHLPSAAEPGAIWFFLPEIEHAFLSSISESAFHGLQRVISSARAVFWISSESGCAAVKALRELVIGLSRVARVENPGLRFVTLALNDSKTAEQILQQVVRVYKHTLHSGDEYEPEYSEQNDLLCVSRVIEFRALNEHISSQTAPLSAKLRPLIGETSVSSMLDVETFIQDRSVKFAQDTGVARPLAPHEIEVEIKAIEQASTPSEPVAAEQEDSLYSSGCSGVVNRVGVDSSLHIGDRVCTLLSRAMCTHARCIDLAVVRIPDWMSFETAACLSADYCASHIALEHLAHIGSGDFVLIDLMSIGLAQACVQLAAQHSPNVYVVAGSDDQVEELERLFPSLKNNVFMKKTASGKRIMKRFTDERTISIAVVSTLHPSSLGNIYKCLGPFARMIQIGPTTNTPASHVENTTVARIDLAKALQSNPKLIGDALRAVMDLIQHKRLKPPIPSKTLATTELEEFLRFPNQNGYYAKAIYTFGKDALYPVIPSAPVRCTLDSKATYLLAGGLGGLGRNIARWMAACGARYILLLSRSGALSEAAQSLLITLQAKGVHVMAPRCDISNKEQVSQVLNECAAHMPPIRGCIQAAMAYENIPFDKCSHASLHSSLSAKVAGSRNLHTLLPTDLSFFVLLSSMAGIVGQPSQSLYAMGNTYQDALARHRTALGLPGVAIDLNVMLDDGYIAERPESLADSILAQGYSGMRRAEFESLLDYYCRADRYPLKHMAESQVVCGLQSPASAEAHFVKHWFWAKTPLMRHLWMRKDSRKTHGNGVYGNGEAGAVASAPYVVRLRAAGSLEEKERIVQEAVAGKLAAGLEFEAKDVDAGRSMARYGMDSLGAIDMREFLRKQLGITIDVLSIMDEQSLKSFCGVVVARIDAAREERQ
ncbi:hypothetical protein MMC17_005989 [Xylographa soralifera]|nr:hypothetical protein [Xylographa soralifera]